MTDNKFKNRAYGFVVIKALNANYNADFTGQPRTLPDGTVYATDKALKYTVRFYLDKEYPDKKVFVFKRYNENQNPYTLAEAYDSFFDDASVKNDDKKTILKNLLSAIDVRLFGVTFAPKSSKKSEKLEDKNVSIHGPIQINHGINIWKEGYIYSEQIMSPFRNPSEREESEEKSASTLGRQSKLQEGHYVHHFSINPKNLSDILEIVGEENLGLSTEDIELLKESLRKGATYYDSAAKAGTENELLFYVELKKDSKLVLPNFTEMIKIEKSDNGKINFDFENIKNELEKYKDEIEKCEVYYNKITTEVENLPEKCEKYDINSGNKI